MIDLSSSAQKKLNVGRRCWSAWIRGETARMVLVLSISLMEILIWRLYFTVSGQFGSVKNDNSRRRKRESGRARW